MIVKFDLYGSHCNSYPIISVAVNDTVIFDLTIVESVTVIIPEVSPGDKVTLIGIGKSQGDNNQWDTVVENGIIVKDKFVIINNITVDDISMGDKWIRSINNNSNGLYNNGSISFTIGSSVLDWIIDERFIKFNQLTDTWSRSGNGKFNYEFVNSKLSAIKKLLND